MKYRVSVGLRSRMRELVYPVIISRDPERSGGQKGRQVR